MLIDTAASASVIDKNLLEKEKSHIKTLKERKVLKLADRKEILIDKLTDLRIWKNQKEKPER